MPHPQFPIGSGFGAATTAQAVLAGLTCPTPPPSSPAATPAWDWKPPARWPRPARVIVAARDAEAARAQTRDIARSRSNRWISPGWTACAISPGASWPADSMSTC